LLTEKLPTFKRDQGDIVMVTENVLGKNSSMRSDRVGGEARNFSLNLALPRKLMIGAILLVALVAFEIFNFDTTRYALQSLLGDTNFMGLQWAVVLAIAFCAIDFAGLTRLFTPEQGQHEARAVWYLTGAWLLGATMNAVMTWWAVNLTLLNHELGNEVMSRQELIRFVPLFVAVLVWLTRILFIGAFALAGDQLFDLAGSGRARTVRQTRRTGTGARQRNDRPFKPQPKSRIRRQPHVPGGGEPVPAGMQAQRRNH
jgi:hypothetical protein